MFSNSAAEKWLDRRDLQTMRCVQLI